MKIIHFIPDSSVQEDYPKPVPTKQVLPEWYKKGEHFIPYMGRGGQGSATGMKRCVPFLDSLICGYVFLTWSDIYVTELEDGSVSIDWGGNPVFSKRPSESGATIPRPAGHRNEHFAWSSPWGWKTPKGYSTLITQPLNRFDLPFITTSGIVDSDKYYSSGNIPFFLKEGFTGIIPKGTPFAQIIPIKRNNWGSSVTSALKLKMQIVGDSVLQKNNSYRDKFWSKKKYE